MLLITSIVSSYFMVKRLPFCEWFSIKNILSISRHAKNQHQVQKSLRSLYSSLFFKIFLYLKRCFFNKNNIKDLFYPEPGREKIKHTLAWFIVGKILGARDKIGPYWHHHKHCFKYSNRITNADFSGIYQLHKINYTEVWKLIQQFIKAWNQVREIVENA